MSHKEAREKCIKELTLIKLIHEGDDEAMRFETDKALLVFFREIGEEEIASLYEEMQEHFG